MVKTRQSRLYTKKGGKEGEGKEDGEGGWEGGRGREERERV